MKGLHQRIRDGFRPDHHDRDFNLFLVVGLCAGLAGGIYASVFNNYLNDLYRLTAEARGIVEVPRELPGVLVVVALALLSALGDVRAAALGMLAAAVGGIGLGLLSPTFGLMMVWMMMYSLGTHITMPLSPSIGMALSKPEEFGARLSRYSAYVLTATIGGFAVVWVGFRWLGMTYAVAFTLVAAFYVLAAFLLAAMKPRRPEKRRVRLFFHRRYLLYYLLAIVNGARKQVFLTFAPWVLIKEFGLGPDVFALLGVVVAIVAIGMRRVVGVAIDRLGERVAVSVEAVLLIALCAGYAFAGRLFPHDVAFYVIAACYVVDASTQAVDMARSTYVRRIAPDASEVTPTLSMGLSLDHIVAFSIPVAGGLLWTAAGYPAVFLAAAGFGAMNFLLSLRMKSRSTLAAEAAARETAASEAQRAEGARVAAEIGAEPPLSAD